MASLDDKQQKSLNALLYDSVAGRNLERTKLCLSRGAQAGLADMKDYFQARGDTAVPLAHLALTSYDKDVLDVLAKGGLVVDEKDRRGETALAAAVNNQNLVCVKHFLALGANPLAELGSGKTVLDLARENRGFAGLDKRDGIIDALLTAAPLADDFNPAAKKSDSAVTTTEAITVNKPISLTPHKKEGFQL